MGDCLSTGNVPGNKAQGAEPILQRIEVLLDAVFDDLGAVPDRAQVRVHPPHHLLGSVAELATHGVEAHRCATIERLQPGRGPGVPKYPGSQLSRFPAGTNRNAIDQFPNVHQHSLRARSRSDWLGDWMIANGTWPVPIMIIENTIALARPDGLQLGSPFHLMEGHHRLGYLHAIEEASGWTAADTHHVLVIRVAEAEVLDYWPLNED